MTPTITFRPLTPDDLPLLVEWLARPHVAEWWDGTPTLEEALEEYGPMMAPTAKARAFIALVDGEPLGYIQYYHAMGSGEGWWEDVTDPGVRGIDQFIGDASRLGQGLGTAMVRAFSDWLFEDPAVTYVHLDPDPSNARAIRCYEKAGFVGDAIIRTPDGLSRLMIRRRPGATAATPDDRRRAVPFDPHHFARRAAGGEATDAVAAFRHAYASNLWSGDASRSGPGSDLDQTAVVRRELPVLLRSLGVRTLLDVPCGDLHWMSRVDLGDVRYIGGDLLPEVVEANRQRYASPLRTFEVLDLATSALPPADLLLCRDCLVHLAFADIARVVENLRRSPVTWLLTTTFPGQEMNEDVHTGDWRPINLQRAPFNWPAPEQLLVEECTEGNGVFADKSLGLWRVASLPPVTGR